MVGVDPKINKAWEKVERKQFRELSNRKLKERIQKQVEQGCLK